MVADGEQLGTSVELKDHPIKEWKSDDFVGHIAALGNIGSGKHFYYLKGSSVALYEIR